MTTPLPALRTARREFLGRSLVLSAAALCPSTLFPSPAARPLRIGLLTDLHYADKAPAGNRHYRETLRKLEETAEQFARQSPAFIVELGDFIDAADSVETEFAWLKTVNQQFSALCPDRHYVLGNHCVDTLKKEEFLNTVEQQTSWYAFERGGFHFVILDSCFRSDGQPYGRRNFQWTDANIPAAQLEWLKADLNDTSKPVILFAHQRLDVSTSHGVRNNAAVREILESSGRVLAVLQGHSHQNDVRTIGGIHYCTLVAMVEGAGPENSGYALMDIEANGTIQLTGFRRQANAVWPKTPR